MEKSIPLTKATAPCSSGTGRAHWSTSRDYHSLWVYLWKSVLMFAFYSSHIYKKATSWFNAPSPTDGITLCKRPTLTKVSHNVHRLKSQSSFENGWGNGLRHVGLRVWNKRERKTQGFICSHPALLHGIQIESEYNLLVFHHSGIDFIPHLQETMRPWVQPHWV